METRQCLAAAQRKPGSFFQKVAGSKVRSGAQAELTGVCWRRLRWDMWASVKTCMPPGLSVSLPHGVPPPPTSKCLATNPLMGNSALPLEEDCWQVGAWQALVPPAVLCALPGLSTLKEGCPASLAA